MGKEILSNACPGKKRVSMSRCLISIFMGLCSLTFIVPFYYMFSNAMKTKTEYYLNQFALPRSWNWKAFSTMITNYKIFRYMYHSVIIVVLTVCTVIPISVCSSYTFAKYRFRGKNAIYLLMIACMTIPMQVIAIPIYIGFGKFNLVNTYAGMLLVNLGMMCGCVVMMSSFFQGIPNELLDEAKIDGCGFFASILHVVIPVGLPAILIEVILTVTNVWNDLFMPQVLLTKTNVKPIMVALTELTNKYQTEPTYMMAGLFMCSMPTLLVFLIFQKYIMRGVLLGAIKG